MKKVNLLNLEFSINKQKIFKKLHIEENTEVYRNADEYFDELLRILKSNMNITTLYAVVDKYELGILDIDSCLNYVICFVSSKDEINNIVNQMMLSGNYLKGYLLNEMAADVIFNSSNEMNKIIKQEFLQSGYKLSKRFAAGDGAIELKYQKNILDVLKKEVDVEACITENYMIVPQKSLLYLYGLKIDEKETYKNCSLHEMKLEEEKDSCSECNECNECSNINCQYRDIK